MGRAIVRNPKVFLFDEPLSNLDAKLRVQMRTEIKKVHQTVKTTTVYVTHDQIEAMTLADRVVVMNHGVIEQVGTPQELYHHPVSRFVAGFIGSPAMNFLPCRVVQAGGGLAVRVNDAIIVPIPAERTARYMPFKDKEMVFGLRPEHLTQVREEGRPGFETIELLVDVVEPMGMETMVHFFVDREPVCARLDPATDAEPERMLKLTADMNQMHLMEKDSGKVV
jgi:multiple sugar transport system ATP-binding protein